MTFPLGIDRILIVINSDNNLSDSIHIMDYRSLAGDEAVEFILQILKEAGRPLTTREVQAETQKKLVRCPDTTVVFLNRLRTRDLIHGQRSKERRGWIWWVED